MGFYDSTRDKDKDKEFCDKEFLISFVCFIFDVSYLIWCHVNSVVMKQEMYDEDGKDEDATVEFQTTNVSSDLCCIIQYSIDYSLSEYKQ